MPERTCGVEGCDRPFRCRNLCNAHYKRLRSHGDPLAGRTAQGLHVGCSEDGCEQPHEARGLCRAHYLRRDHAINREWRNATVRQWNRENAEARRAYRAANRERRAAQVAAWKLANPERVAEHEYRRRTRKRGAMAQERYERREIFDRDGWICQLCMEPVTEDPTIDHIVPLCEGGPDIRSNVQLAHRSCNCQKGRQLTA